jgi:hypothetical protein
MSRESRTGWHLTRTPALLLAASPTTKAYQKDLLAEEAHLSVFVGEEDEAWHMSISHRWNEDNSPGRYPTWDEIRDARYEFCPKAAIMAMILPPKENYVNVHATTFHLFQIPGE